MIGYIIKIFTKKIIQILTGSLLFFPTVSFSSQEASWDHMGGYIFGVGNSYGKLTNGTVLNAHLVAFIPSVSLEYIRNNNIKNAFLGVGFTNLIQFQFGTGNQGYVKRIRSDIFLMSIIDSRKSQFSFPLMYPKRKNSKWYDKIAINIGISKYNRDSEYQYQFGIGTTI